MTISQDNADSQAADGRDGIWRRLVYFSLLVCIAITALTFLRFLFTPLGVDSLGRHWGYFINYSDFGLIRRGLVGTVISPFLPDNLSNGYMPLLVLYPIFLITIILLGWTYSKSLGLTALQTSVFCSMLVLSPAFSSHSAYSTGDFNVVLVICFLTSLIFIKRAPVIFILLVVAMLVHEIFLLAFVPALCVALYLESGRKLNMPFAYACAAVALGLFLVTQAKLQLNFEDYSNILRTRAPMMEGAGHFEMTAGFKENIAYTLPLYNRVSTFLYILPSLAYLALLIIFFVPRNGGVLLKAMFIGAAVSPLIMLGLASDLYRWISLACVATIGMGGFVASRGITSAFSKRPVLAAAFAIPWIVLGPFGSACDPRPEEGCRRPFPMFQFALERL